MMRARNAYMINNQWTSEVYMNSLIMNMLNRDSMNILFNMRAVPTLGSWIE